MKALSISDDDLCAGCANLNYDPGSESVCTKQNENGEWPCAFNQDGYVISCPKYSPCTPGSNWVEQEKEAHHDETSNT